MNVLIATDMEGIAGIDREEQVKPRGNPDYEAARPLLMDDVNAAVEGALEGGASGVYVTDGHMGGGNFLEGRLHSAAALLPKGAPYPTDISAGLFIGCHAMAGTMNAFLDHTGWHKHVFSLTINGRLFGEIGRFAARLGHVGCPLVMVSGCEAACKEARDFAGEVEFASVKRALGRNAALLVPLDEARRRIRLAASRAMKRAADLKPFRPLFPAEVVQVLCGTELAELAMKREGVERVDARTVRKIAATALDLDIL